MSADFSIDEWLDNRTALRQDFLVRVDRDNAILTPVGADSSFRRYFRVRQESRPPVILMESVPDNSQMATPGHRVGDFVRIGRWLRDHGFHAPDIYDVDESTGYVLLEDLGDTSFKEALIQNIPAEDVYGLATDVLSALAQLDKKEMLSLPSYYESHVHDGRRHIVDWCRPALCGEKNPPGLTDEYLTVWDRIEKSLPPCAQHFLHIDYHAQNLMWLPDEEGVRRCGILDFQGAMIGPAPYDLANLLEDARIDVSSEIRGAMLSRYTADMDQDNREAFLLWYRVLASQFHCRLMGQFIRLAVRDNKPQYLNYLPRVSARLREGLSHPVLKPLQSWFAEQNFSFNDMTDLKLDDLSLFL